MIEVNLLPEEYRRVDKTPLPIFLLLLSSIVLVSAAVIGYIYFEFVFVRNKATESERIQQINNEVLDLEKEVADLQAETEQYNVRRNLILQIRKSRILWAKKLYYLSDLKPEDIWFESVEMEQLDAFKAKHDADAIRKWNKENSHRPPKPVVQPADGGAMNIALRQKGNDFKIWTNFKRDLLDHRIFGPDFMDPIELGEDGVRLKIEEEAKPEDRITLQLEFVLKLLPPEV